MPPHTAPGEVLVLTAGRGTRLRPLSHVRAKAALPVAGDALVRRILRWLAGSGITSAVLNLHHKPETIARQVGDGADLGLAVRYSWEHPLLGSAGGPRKALALLDPSRFLLVNGDTLTDVDLEALRQSHLDSGALVTMALIPNPVPTQYGGVIVDDGGWVTGFSAPGEAGAPYHFVGVQIAESSVFVELEDGRAVNSVGDVYPRLIDANPRAIHGFVCGATFRDIGTPADYLATSLAVAEAEGSSPLALQGHRTEVHSTARLVRSVLWDDVVVERDVELVECVVADRVRVPANSRFVRQTIVAADGRSPAANETRVGQLFVAPIDRSASLGSGKGAQV